MLTSVTMNKLYELRLAGMAESYRRQMEDIATFGALGFEERFGMMVDAEWGSKRSKRLATLIKNAMVAPIVKTKKPSTYSYCTILSLR